MAIFFNGQLLIRPQAASLVNDNALNNPSPAAVSNVGIVGVSSNGQPKTSLQFNSPAAAIQALVDGPLLDQVLFTFAPSPSAPGASTVFAFRADPATQSGLVLEDAGSNPVITLASDDYGLLANLVRISIAPGSNSGTFRITQARGQSSVSKDNIGRSSFSLSYQGAGTAATMTIALSGGSGSLTTNITGATGDNLNLSFSQYTNILELVNAINTNPAYTAAAIDQNPDDLCVDLDTVTAQSIYSTPAVFTGTGFNASNLNTTHYNLSLAIDGFPSTVIDVTGDMGVGGGYTLTSVVAAINAALTAVDASLANVASQSGGQVRLTSPTKGDTSFVKVGNGLAVTNDAVLAVLGLSAPANTVVQGVEGTYVAKSNLQAIVDYLNSSLSPFVSAVRAANVGTAPAFIGFTYLTGATDPAPTNQDYQDAFNAMANIDIQLVGVASIAASLHAMANAHCILTSAAGKRRRCILGGGATETVSQLLARAVNLNSYRAKLAAPGHSDFDPVTGNLTDYDASYTAAKFLGLTAGGVSPGTPTTYEFIQAQALAVTFTDENGGDLDVLTQGGVCPVQVTKKGFRIANDVSTWLQDTKIDKVEFGTGICLDLLQSLIEDAISTTIIGKKGSTTLVGQAASATETVLLAAAKDQSKGGLELLVGDSTSPAFGPITVSISGDTITTSVQVQPAIGINYGLTILNAVPFSSSVTV